MDKVLDLQLEDMNLTDLGLPTDMNVNNMLQNPMELIQNFKFSPSDQMKVAACYLLVLLVSISLVRNSNGFIRVFGLTLLIISLVALILFILAL